ncbi:ABC-F family ATP-binding cassette domain-containing protein [Vagococcus intermedius]|uniref:ABC-F family ATP-binding cassette domain-containing protein n=1 Tax=Vagococcus intermedius TaxID=2991418 RepID=A0AAF0CVK4_9ENTE|nr:ABC-F family ATP-binding cassette domain-containing protein [Vagococcus intermedius]WEG73688.1 ABC-F family ATP-binding cassette domain-containing protein [Vagococcus intermedius]WEG75772.1 ABC-F family ATP-binding cassette domain-containing protein [Vagococcus intermedius]
MILLQANQVARHFGAEVLFDHIQLEIQDRSRIALVGRNGAGKSTLLKIIAGIDEPDEGTISKTKALTIGYLDQHTGLSSDKTIWEEMLTAYDQLRALETRLRQLEYKIGQPELLADEEAYARLLKEYDQLQHNFNEQNGYGYESEIKAVLNGFRFDQTFYDRPISSLSGGQKTRLALAKLLLERPDLLILDEPTNHLDIETLSWLENYLQNYRGALLLVSHDRYFLDKIVTEVYDLSRHKMTHYKGNYSKFLELKAEKLASDWKAFEKQQTEINKLEEFVAKNIVRASTTKRAQSRRKQLDKMERLDRPVGDEKSARFLFDIEKQSGNIVLQTEDSAIGYDETILCEPINLDIRKQEAIALVGPNGIGKSTLLKSIIGQLPFIKGNTHLGTNVTIGYYDQEQADLRSHKTVLNELWDEHSTVPEKDIRSVLGSFLFSGEDVEKTVPLLSGGEKARLALAKLSMDKENFLILDEPTNHLDIDSKEVLENALINYEGTLLFVSHDRYFINRIATKVIELSETGSTLYLGDYDYYLEKKLEAEELALLKKQNSETKETVTLVSNKNQFQQSKDYQRKIRSLTRKIEQIELELAEVDDTITATQMEMANPLYIEDHSKLMTLQATLNELELKQENLMTQWETLGLELEEQ